MLKKSEEFHEVYVTTWGWLTLLTSHHVKIWGGEGNLNQSLKLLLNSLKAHAVLIKSYSPTNKETYTIHMNSPLA